MKFKKIKRKPSYVNMTAITAKTGKDLLENGYNGKKVSFSEEDKQIILRTKDNEIVGFVATDGESYWFINYNYAVKNYEIPKEWEKPTNDGSKEKASLEGMRL